MALPDVDVKRFAIKYDPPTLCVEYKIGGGRTVLRKISFKKCSGKTPDEVADSLLRKCEDILGPENARRVSEEQVRDLVTLLLTPDDGQPGTIYENEVEEFGDLNAVSEEENARAKAKMSEVFHEKRILPGQEGYVYDKRMDFTPEGVSEWDDDEDEE